MARTAKPKPPPKSKLLRKYVAAASLVLFALGAAVALSYLASRWALQNPTFSTEVLPPIKLGRTLPESGPVRLKIPAIGVDAPFVELGLAENNEIEIPETYEGVGWYVHGPTPGELGPSVVLGHVDSKTGPAVFFSLGQLEPGDTVGVERGDGTTATFRVDRLERYPQSNFPTSLVYGDLDYAGLRLITCSGSYDRESKRYEANLIVYASLAATE